MKLFHTTFFCLVLSTIMQAQLTTFIENFTSPAVMAIHGDNLYVADESSIWKIDLSFDPPAISSFYNSPGSEFTAMVIVGDNMILADLAAEDMGYFYNINAASPTYKALDVSFGAEEVSGMTHDNGKIFYGNFDDPFSDFNYMELEIYDESSYSRTGVTVEDADEPFSTAVIGSNLYFLDADEIQVKAMSSTDFDDAAAIIENLDDAFTIEANGNLIYFHDDNSIHAADISTSPVTLSEVVEVGDIVVSDMMFIGEDLYIADFNGGKVLKYTPTGTTSIKDAQQFSFKIVPNPASNSIQLQGWNSGTYYNLYNVQGQLMLNGSLLQDQSIDVSSFDKGNYYIEVDNHKIGSFTKQ